MIVMHPGAVSPVVVVNVGQLDDAKVDVAAAKLTQIQNAMRPPNQEWLSK